MYDFPNKQPFHEFLDELREAYNKNLLRNFVCLYSRDHKNDEEDEIFVGKNLSYWFGESSTECLGLTDLMKEMILDYIREANTRAEE